MSRDNGFVQGSLARSVGMVRLGSDIRRKNLPNTSDNQVIRRKDVKIETERLLLRPLKKSDADPLARIWSDPNVTRYMGGSRDFNEVCETFEADANSSSQTDFDLWPVVEKASGQVVGHCGLIDKEVEGEGEFELVYVFDTSVWGKGYATEAASAVRDYAFEQLGLQRIIALIDPENIASERVASKVGMQFEKETCRPSGKILRVYVVKADPRTKAA